MQLEGGIMRHRVEVDQSIKIEDTGATVLAFANGIAAAVIIPGPVKRAALNALLLRGKSRQIARLMLFAAGLALLLQDHLDDLERVVIDIEYEGQEAPIREFLLIYIWRTRPAFEPWRITFKQVGKQSPAHTKANAVRQGKDRGFRKLKEDEMLALLR
jgi:hypothetical protein